MAQMSLEVQKQKMWEMRSSLVDFCTLINSRIAELSQTLNNNVAMGFPVEVAQYYKHAYLMVEEQEIDQLVQVIQKGHFDYIDDVVSDIDKALKRQN